MKKLFALLACMMLLAGCTKSNIVNATEETRAVSAPDMELRDDIEIDWAQVSDDTEWIFNNEDRYPYTRDYRFYLEPNKKEIMLMWVVADDLPDSEIRNYAEALIKEFNDAVAIQDFSIATSSKDSYGGLWDEYGLSFSLVPESTQDEEDTWFISGSYGAGIAFQLPDTSALLSGNAEAADAAEGETVEETEAETEPETEAADENAAEAPEIETAAAQGPGLEVTEADTQGPEAEKKEE